MHKTKGRHYRNIQNSINVTNFKGKYRRKVVIISRLRLEHIGLKANLQFDGEMSDR